MGIRVEVVGILSRANDVTRKPFAFDPGRCQVGRKAEGVWSNVVFECQGLPKSFWIRIINRHGSTCAID
jgi:hypothetical protein